MSPLRESLTKMLEKQSLTVSLLIGFGIKVFHTFQGFSIQKGVHIGTSSFLGHLLCQGEDLVGHPGFPAFILCSTLAISTKRAKPSCFRLRSCHPAYRFLPSRSPDLAEPPLPMTKSAKGGESYRPHTGTPFPSRNAVHGMRNVNLGRTGHWKRSWDDTGEKNKFPGKKQNTGKTISGSPDPLVL